MKKIILSILLLFPIISYACDKESRYDLVDKKWCTVPDELIFCLVHDKENNEFFAYCIDYFDECAIDTYAEVLKEKHFPLSYKYAKIVFPEYF